MPKDFGKSGACRWVASDRAVRLAKIEIGWGRVRSSGLSADTAESAEHMAARYAGHSLRSGLATSAAMGGAAGHQIQKHLRHKRYDTTAGYIRAASLFKDNAAGAAGL